jgi:[NiFe] hydrogenase diaphorase moiety large subunit
MNQMGREELKNKIDLLVSKHGGNRGAILPVLEEISKEYGEIDLYAMQTLAFSVGIHPSEIYGVATFYDFLNAGKKHGKYVIRLCKTISCHMKEKDRIAKQLNNELGISFGETTSDGTFTLEYCNCLGMCDQGPAMLINGVLISKVKSSDIPLIIQSCRKGLLEKEYKTPLVSKVVKKGPLLDKEFSPGSILIKAMENGQENILKDIEKSNLKGRGGAGFPTGFKWRLAKEEKKDKKIIVCNADEGEPGTFKDRYILHKNFQRVLEGMSIAAYVIGASKGFIYLRGEYTYLKELLEKEIEKRRQSKLLGNQADNGLLFDIEIRMGAGAYICGEETALIESLEGKRGEPRNKPPYPVDTGFMNHPTLVNNVETFLNVTLICERGVKSFGQYGTDSSKGTKFFSISGDCKNEGIYELPFGITIDKIVELAEGENIKAVQIGGAAGECIPKSDFAKRIAFEAVPTGGSIILFNENRDLLDIAENFMEFFVEESCGQCTPCREGTYRILEGIRLLKKGECSVSYLDKLLDLCETIELASKCGLGQLSTVAFQSIVKNFKEEILGRLPEEGQYL